MNLKAFESEQDLGDRVTGKILKTCANCGITSAPVRLYAGDFITTVRSPEGYYSILEIAEDICLWCLGQIDFSRIGFPKDAKTYEQTEEKD